MKKPKILFCNIGWMKEYRGLERRNDKIVHGGSWVKEHGYGFEIYNFKPHSGSMYGFVQIRPSKKGSSGRIHIDRLGANAEDVSIDNVTVVWTATPPKGGRCIVGWYSDATVFRHYQKAPAGSQREHTGRTLGYYVTARAENCALLPTDKRDFQVSGMGMANLWYAQEPKDEPFNEEVLRYIRSY